MKNHSFASQEDIFDSLQSALTSYHIHSASYYEEFCKRALVRNALKGETLVAEGQVCDSLFFVVEGFCFCYYIRDGKECIMDFFRKGEFAVIFHSFWKRQPSFLTLKTSEKTTVLVLKYTDFVWLFDAFPDFRELIFLIQMNYLIREETVRCVLRCYSAEERILFFLKSHEIQLFMRHIPQYRIASWLNMAPETFAKIWGQL